MGGFTALELQAQVPRLRRYARALTGARDGADDLVQDTLERAWLKRALWQPGTHLRAWLFAVMHNVYVNERRRWRPVEPLDTTDDGPLGAGEPGHPADSRLALRDIERALAQLSDDQRAVILLVGLEQLSYAEAARALAVPLGTVMSRLSRGRERLRELLDPASQHTVHAGAALRRIK